MILLLNILKILYNNNKILINKYKIHIKIHHKINNKINSINNIHNYYLNL